jgi:glycosyltransferase involved in cell wall biosynthesis
MRIATLGPSGSFGGIQTHFRLLNEFLEKEGHDVLCVHMVDEEKNPSPECPQASTKHLAIRGGAGLLRKIRMMPSVFTVSRQVASFRPELVVACALGNSYMSVGRAVRSGCLKFYQEVIGDVPLRNATRSKMSKIYGCTACQSERLVDSVRRAVRPLPKIGVLPCFADPVGERYACRSRPPRSGETIKLGFFGRLAINKGIEHLLRGFLNSSNYHRCELHIHGRGPLLEMVKEAKLGSDPLDRIILRGPYSDDADLASRLAEMHGLVLTSQFGEGLPLVLIEAMSVGLPFFATNICGIPDAALGNPDCLLCDPDQGSVGAGITRFTDMLLQNSFETSRLCSFYERCFSSEVMKESWREFLRAPNNFFKTYTPL